MKLRSKTAILLTLVIVFLSNAVLPVTVNAASSDLGATGAQTLSVVPLNNNTNTTAVCFQIIDGEGIAEATFVGYDHITTGATITIKIQKKTLFWWSDVDNGQPDNTWTDVVYGTQGIVSHSLPITKTGKYRAIFTFTVSGYGNEDDIIEQTYETEYN